MSTRALKVAAAPRIFRKRGESCPVAAILRQVAACRRLLNEEYLEARLRELPRRDRSEMTALYVKRRLLRRLKALEVMASELQPTSTLGAAYQLLLAMNWACMDDEIDAAVEGENFGGRDTLMDQTDVVQNTVLSAYLALRPLVRDADLTLVERPHGLNGWKPNKTISALIAMQETA